MSEAADETMMRLALEQARLAAEAGEVPVGAVVFRGDQVLASAHNLRERQADPTAHAEILALRQAARAVGVWRLDGCAIAVTLEPCPMCAGALLNSRIERLVYGAPDPKMGCVKTMYELCTDTRFNHRLIVRSGVLADECAAVLQAFFKARRGDDKPSKPAPENPG
jgi:tRNA(adenine34) deaminase